MMKGNLSEKHKSLWATTCKFVFVLLCMNLPFARKAMVDQNILYLRVHEQLGALRKKVLH